MEIVQRELILKHTCALIRRPELILQRFLTPGVEAQTVTVWKQANKYKIPRIAYHNKMDKLGANFKLSVKTMKEKLGASPLIIQLPVGAEKTFAGVVDLISMEKVTWDTADVYGTNYKREPLSASEDLKLYNEAIKYRELLLEQLADVDDNLAESIINSADMSDIPVMDIHNALRRATILEKGVPTLCGSSFKNKGVQPLLDAVVNYLPSPLEIKYEFLDYYKNELCSLAFKTVHDKQRGALTFVRLYSGHLNASDTVYNVNKRTQEKIAKIFQISADEHREIPSASAGNIVALSGLRFVSNPNLNSIIIQGCQFATAQGKRNLNVRCS